MAGSKRGSRGFAAPVRDSTTTRLRDTARFDVWMVGACFEERAAGDLDLNLSFSRPGPEDWRLWLSEMIEVGAMALSFSLSSSAARLRFPRVACALASAPKEILLSDDRTSPSETLSSSLL